MTIQRANPIDSPTDNQTGDQSGDQTNPSHREDLLADSVETGDMSNLCLWIGFGASTALILIGWFMVKQPKVKE